MRSRIASLFVIGFLLSLLVVMLALPRGVVAVDFPGRASADRALRSSVAIFNGSVSFCGGVIVAARVVLTANHCVTEISAATFVLTWSGRKHLVTLLRSDEGVDLALLQTSEDIDGAVARLAQDVAAGERVFNIGSPYGETFVLIGGYVSKVGRGRFAQSGPGSTEVHLVLMVPAVYFGSSGGGLFNDEGDLVGIAVRVSVVPVTFSIEWMRGKVLWSYFVGDVTLKAFLGR